MSFDVFLTAFQGGKPTPANAAAARDVPTRYRHRHDRGAYVIEFNDGSGVELFAGGLDGRGEKAFNGGMFALHGMAPSVTDFIYEFAHAAECAVIPAMEPSCVVVTRADLKSHLPGSLVANSQYILVADGSELGAVLEGGHTAWQAYRDSILGKQNLPDRK